MKTNKRYIAIALICGLACKAAANQWTGYLGADAGVALIQKVEISNWADAESDTVDLTFKPGSSIGLEGGVTRGALSLGLELQYVQAGFDKLKWYYEGKQWDQADSVHGSFRQILVAPTVRYCFLTRGKLSLHGGVSGGLSRREFAKLRHENSDNEVVFDNTENTWFLKPMLMLRYGINERSSLSLRYAYSFSGKTGGEDLSRNEAEDGDPHVDVAGIKTHYLTVGYAYSF